MNNDTPKSTGRPATPERMSLHSMKEEELEGKEKGDSLFYAYALKVDDMMYMVKVVADTCAERL